MVKVCSFRVKHGMADTVVPLLKKFERRVEVFNYSIIQSEIFL